MSNDLWKVWRLLFRQNLEDKSAELDSVTDSFTKLQQKVAEQRETINQMNHTMTKNEQLLVKRTKENEELSEKSGALQNNLDTVFKWANFMFLLADPRNGPRRAGSFHRFERAFSDIYEVVK